MSRSIVQQVQTTAQQLNAEVPVYFLRWLDNPAVLRVRITDREVEQVADLTNLPTTGSTGPWLGLGPDDSPLVLKDTGTQDIYAMDWEEP